MALIRLCSILATRSYLFVSACAQREETWQSIEIFLWLGAATHCVPVLRNEISTVYLTCILSVKDQACDTSGVSVSLLPYLLMHQIHHSDRQRGPFSSHLGSAQERLRLHTAGSHQSRLSGRLRTYVFFFVLRDGSPDCLSSEVCRNTLISNLIDYLRQLPEDADSSHSHVLLSAP